MRAEWDVIPSDGRRRVERRFRSFIVMAMALMVALALVSSDAAPPATTALSADPPGTPVGVPHFDDVRTVEDRVLPTTAGAAAATTAPPAPGSSAAGGNPPTPAGQPPKSEDVPDEWIVQLRDGQPAEQIAAEHAAEQDAEVRDVYSAAIDGYAAHMTDDEALAVASDPRVASVTRDRLFHMTAQTTPPGIPRSKALGIAQAVSGGSEVDADIAVLDTGIDATHPDLNYRAGKNCISSSKAPTDDEGHGTHVAGSAAARDNGSDVVGIAPGARVWAVKVLDSTGSGRISQIVCGLDWVAQNARNNGVGIEVATMSLGGDGSDGSCGSDPMHNAICNVVNAGVPVTVAAGNDGNNAANHTPAAYDEVITVSAYADRDGKPGGLGSTCGSTRDDAFASFSNYGADVDITAPGVCILSTKKGGGTVSYSGTSMATPHVAGAAAAYLAANPGASPAAVKNALQNNGTTDWTGDKDSNKEPALNLGFLGGTGLVSGGGTTTTTTPGPTTTTSSTTTTTAAPGSITVTLTPGTYDSGTKSKVKVSWSGATSSSVDVWRGATRVKAGTANDGVHTDKLGVKQPSGSQLTYKVCNAGSTTACSAPKTVTFP